MPEETSCKIISNSLTLGHDLINFFVMRTDVKCNCTIPKGGDDIVLPGLPVHTSASTSVHCQTGKGAEVDAAIRKGRLTKMKTCAKYCSEGSNVECNMICIKETFDDAARSHSFGAPAFTECTAKLDGRVCDSCSVPNSLLGWGWDVSVDCSNVGGVEYKFGKVRDYGDNVTFETGNLAFDESENNFTIPRGEDGTIDPSWLRGSYYDEVGSSYSYHPSPFSSETFVTFVSFLLAVMLVLLRYYCRQRVVGPLMSDASGYLRPNQQPSPHIARYWT